MREVTRLPRLPEMKLAKGAQFEYECIGLAWKKIGAMEKEALSQNDPELLGKALHIRQGLILHDHLWDRLVTGRDFKDDKLCKNAGTKRTVTVADHLMIHCAYLKFTENLIVVERFEYRQNPSAPPGFSIYSMFLNLGLVLYCPFQPDSLAA